MVVNDHEFPFAPIVIHVSGSVGNQQALHSQEIHHAHRQGNLLKRVPFIKMKSALHGQHLFAPHVSVNQLPFVELHR